MPLPPGDGPRVPNPATRPTTHGLFGDILAGLRGPERELPRVPTSDRIVGGQWTQADGEVSTGAPWTVAWVPSFPTAAWIKVAASGVDDILVTAEWDGLNVYSHGRLAELLMPAGQTVTVTVSTTEPGPIAVHLDLAAIPLTAGRPAT